jgi:putative addiction module component (TIGR02574 family)
LDARDDPPEEPPMPATAAETGTELDTLFRRALELPPEYRQELALRLLDELDGEEVSEAEADAAWEEEIRRRLAEIDAGTAEMVPASEVFSRAREILRDG